MTHSYAIRCGCRVMHKYIYHISSVLWKSFWTDPSHKPHNASDQYPIMHCFVTEMCTHVHISVTKWCIVGQDNCIVGFLRMVYFVSTTTELSGPVCLSFHQDGKTDRQDHPAVLWYIHYHFSLHLCSNVVWMSTWKVLMWLMWHYGLCCHVLRCVFCPSMDTA